MKRPKKEVTLMGRSTRRIIISIFITLVIGVLIPPSESRAQWSRLVKESANYVYCMSMSGGSLRAGTNHGLFVSSDMGATWERIRSIGGGVLALAENGTYLFAGSAGGFGTPSGNGVYRSADGGANWFNVLPGVEVSSLRVVGTNLFMGIMGVQCVFRSTDDGITWDTASAGLPEFIGPGAFASIPNPTAPANPYTYVGASNYGVYISTDNGGSWSAVNQGLPFATTVHAFATRNSAGGLGDSVYIFAGSDNGVHRLASNGAYWTQVSSGLPVDTPLYSTLGHVTRVFAFAQIGVRLFAGTPHGVFCSTDDGTSWISTSRGLPPNSSVLSLTKGPSTAGSGDTILFAGTNGSGVFKSTDNGASWSIVDSVLADRNSVAAILAMPSLGGVDTSLFAGTNIGVFHSSNDGATWSSASVGLPQFERVRNLVAVTDPAKTAGVHLFAGTDSAGVFHSSNNGANWNKANQGLPDLHIRGLVEIPHSNGAGPPILAVGTNSGVYVSSDYGTSWVAANAGLTNPHISALAMAPLPGGTNLLAGTAGGGLFLSSNGGQSWVATNTGLTNSWINALGVTFDSSMYRTRYTFAATGGGIFRSSDNGAAWSPFDMSISHYPITAFAAVGAYIFAGTSPSGVYLSGDEFQNWTSVNTGSEFLGDILTLGTHGGYLYAGTSNGLWRRHLSEMVSGATAALSDSSVDFGNVLPESTSDTVQIVTSNRGYTLLRISSINWRHPEYQLPGLPLLPATIPPGGSVKFSVFFRPSQAGAVVWDTISIVTNDSLHPTSKIALLGRGSNAAQAAAGEQIYSILARSTGMNLYTIDKATGHAKEIEALGPNPPTRIDAFAVRPIDHRIYAASNALNATLLYRVSPVFGDLEPAGSIPVNGIAAMAFSTGDEFYLADTTRKLYRMQGISGSTNTVGTMGRQLSSLAFNPATGQLWGSAHDTIWTISTATAAMTVVGAGFPGVGHSSITFSALGTLYGIYDNAFVAIDHRTGAATAIGTIGSVPLKFIAMRSDPEAADVSVSPELPRETRLDQNYPNPFNPSTAIRYALPHASRVSLKVYNTLGQEVATLVSDTKPAGVYTVEFDARSLASGIYFYRIQAGNFVDTKKLILLR